MVMKKKDTIQFYNLCNKKGSSHFEILISFVLFVGFTLFLLFTLEPTKKDLLEESILFNVQSVFFEQTTTNVSYVLVDTTGSGCPGGWESARICRPGELSWVDEAIWSKAGKDCLFNVYTSSEFKDKGSSDLDNELNDVCNRSNTNKNYSIGYIYREDVLSNKTLITMKNRYNSQYATLKDELKVPEVVDFAIDSSDDLFDMTKTVPDEAEVIAGTYRKKVLYANGSIINHDFTIKVW